MKCYHHPDRDAVATCNECGRGLCQECASLYATPFCSDCTISIATKYKKELENFYGSCGFMIVLISLVFAVVYMGVSPLLALPAGATMGFSIVGCVMLFSGAGKRARKKEIVRTVYKVETLRSGVPPFDEPNFSLFSDFQRKKPKDEDNKKA